MKILLPITESASSAAAVAEVKKRFWPSGTTVRVLHLVEKFVPPAQQLWYDARGSLDRAREEVKQHYTELAEETAKQLRQAGLTVETSVRNGDPRKAIVATANDWGAELIVMGAHHHSAIAGIFLGNIAQTVMNHSSCPVEIVPARSRAKA